MTTVVVRNQAELDAALEEAGSAAWIDIEIRSERGVWLEVGSVPGSASVRAFGSASVNASGSASVSASGSASVSAFGSASVRATPHVAVHLHSSRAHIQGGVLINNKTADTWLEHHGITVEDGRAIVYKAVDDALNSGHAFAYPIGETVTDPHWRDDNECGGGLHFCPSPTQAQAYFEEATRFLACSVAVDDLRVIDDPYATPKLKARSAVVLFEVDGHGERLVVAA
jgi:hypothetical protein